MTILHKLLLWLQIGLANNAEWIVFDSHHNDRCSSKMSLKYTECERLWMGKTKMGRYKKKSNKPITRREYCLQADV